MKFSRMSIAALVIAGVLVVPLLCATTTDAGAVSPSTNVVLPGNGSFVSGQAVVLDAVASAGATGVTFTIGAPQNVVLTATPTYYGWLAVWNSTTTPNGGPYEVTSTASFPGGQSVTSSPVPIYVSNQPPTSQVILPSNGAIVSGNTVLDAVAQSGTPTVQFEISDGSPENTVVLPATPTYYGWLAAWNTTDVPNGVYLLFPMASWEGGAAANGPAITVTVDNVPLQTQLLLPKNASEISGNVVFDASAQGTNITGVYFVVTFGPLSEQKFLTATPTYYGWIGEWNSLACPPGYPNGSYVFQSVVTQAGGGTAMSPPVDVTLLNSPGGCP